MQEMMDNMSLRLQAKSDGRGQEESGGAGRGAASGIGGIGEISPGNRRELPAAVGVGLGETAGGDSSSRPGAEGVPVRALGVPAKGGFGGFQNTDSLCRLGRAGRDAAAAGGTGQNVIATDSSNQEESSAAGEGAAGGGLNAQDTRDGVSQGGGGRIDIPGRVEELPAEEVGPTVRQQGGGDGSGGAADGTPSESVDRGKMVSSGAGAVSIMTKGRRRRSAVGTCGFDGRSVDPGRSLPWRWNHFSGGISTRYCSRKQARQ